MPSAYSVRGMESCKSQTFSCCLLNNTNKNHHKSCKIPTKFQIPKSLSFAAVSKPISHLSNFPCSSLSSSRFSVNPDNPVLKLLGEAMTQKILSLTTDSSGKRLTSWMSRALMSDVKKRIDIVLDEVVPLLLDSADRWISSRLTVSSDVRISFDKLRSEEMMAAPSIEANRSNSIFCTKSAFATSIVSLLPKEKAESVEDFSHSTT